MGFKEFLSATTLYAWLIIIIILIIAVAYGVKFYLQRRKDKSVETPEGVVEGKLPSQEELMLMLQDLEKEKPKKAEAIIRADKKVKKQKVIEEPLEDSAIVPYSPTKSKSKRSFGYWKDWYMNKYHTGKVILINMELTNGFHRTFTVLEKDDGFIFRKKKYLFDDENKYYNIDATLYQFDFHEGIALPIRRKIPVTAIKKTLESTEGIDIEYAINPSTLQRFMTAKIAEGVMKGTQLDEFMKKLNMFIIVIMVAVLIHLALFLYASGILQNVKLPF